MKNVFSNKSKMNGTASKTLKAEGITLVKTGAQTKFIDAFDEMAPKLYRFCLLRVSSKELAEDLVSQTFLQTWEYLQRNNKINHYPSFLYKSLRNLIADHWRAKKSKTLSLDEELIATLVDYGQMPEKLAGSVDFKRIIEASGKLPEDQREILHWYFIDGLPAREISRISGKKTNAVYVSIFRSTQKLKKIFNDV